MADEGYRSAQSPSHPLACQCLFLPFCSFPLLSFEPSATLFPVQLALHHAWRPTLHPFFLNPDGRGAVAKTTGILAWLSGPCCSVGYKCDCFRRLLFTRLASPWVFSSGSACLVPKQAGAFLFKFLESWRNKILWISFQDTFLHATSCRTNSNFRQLSCPFIWLLSSFSTTSQAKFYSLISDSNPGIVCCPPNSSMPLIFPGARSTKLHLFALRASSCA